MLKWNYNVNILLGEVGGKAAGNKDVRINNVAAANNPKNNSMMFFTQKKWDDEYLQRIGNVKGCFIIIEKELSNIFEPLLKDNCVVVTENARLYFAKALNHIINSKNTARKYRTYGMNCIIGENVSIGEDTIIEPFVFIDHDVVIGNNVIIKSGAKIRQNVIIRNNVVIGENSVIGGQGFGVEKDELMGNVRIPHVGGVIIEEKVEIGALTSIVSGTINPTVIERNAFIDDLNHIAHNCNIGRETLATAAVQIGGSAAIGANSYIAPNATIRNGISIGEDCFIGQASSVQESCGDNCSLVGNPAREFKIKNQK